MMWKSIIIALEIVDQGACWRVGTGEHIEIWKHRQISTPNSFKLQLPTTMLQENAIVYKLLITCPIEGALVWNEELIENIF